VACEIILLEKRLSEEMLPTHWLKTHTARKVHPGHRTPPEVARPVSRKCEGCQKVSEDVRERSFCNDIYVEFGIEVSYDLLCDECFAGPLKNSITAKPACAEIFPLTSRPTTPVQSVYRTSSSANWSHFPPRHK
jgi:hypothetical protein